MKKKILIVANEFKNFYLFRKELIESFSEKDFTIYLVGKFDSYESYFDKNEYILYNIDFFSNKKFIFNELKTIKNLAFLLFKVKPDVVLSFTIKPNIYLGFLNHFSSVIFIPNVSGIGTMFITGRINKIIGILAYKLSLISSSVVFFQNKSQRDYFHTNKIIHRDKSKIIPGSGVVLNKKFTPKHISTDIKIVFVGRLILDKGIIDFIEASNFFKNSNRLNFYIIGDYNKNNPRSIDFEILKKWEENANCYYLGPKDNLKSILTFFDLLVLPSYSEGLSKALLDACNSGVPIVTSDIPGCRDVFSDNGYLIKVKNSIEIINSISDFQNLSLTEINRISKNGYNNVKTNFGVDLVIKKYHESINQFLTKSKI